MTEDEAKEKWCPFVRVTVRDDGAYIERPEGLCTIRCIASECMAWRKDGHKLEPDKHHPNELIETLPIGYCGLAGKP